MTVPVRRLCALALTAVVWTAGNAPGQSRPAVELLVSAGFANHLRAPWGPVTVTARNLGGDAVRGELVFEARDARDGFRSRRDVFLGPSSTKRITFYIPATWGTVRFLVDGKPYIQHSLGLEFISDLDILDFVAESGFRETCIQVRPSVSPVG